MTVFLVPFHKMLFRLYMYNRAYDNSYIIAQTAFHHCTFQVITAHFVHHCALKPALIPIQKHIESKIWCLRLLCDGMCMIGSRRKW